jgi:hypothetical protein
MLVVVMATQSAFSQGQGVSPVGKAALTLEVERPGPLTRYEFTIPGVHPQGQNLLCFLHVQGGKARSWWALRKSPEAARPDATAFLEAAEVVADGDRLRGKAAIRFDDGKAKGSETYLAQLEIDLKRLVRRVPLIALHLFHSHLYLNGEIRGFDRMARTYGKRCVNAQHWAGRG